MKTRFRLRVVKGTFEGDSWLFDSIEELDAFIVKTRDEDCGELVMPMTMEVIKCTGRKKEKVSER